MARQLIEFAHGPIVYDSIMMDFIQKIQPSLFACSCLFEKFIQLNKTRNKVTPVWVSLDYCINLSITKMNCFDCIPTK